MTTTLWKELDDRFAERTAGGKGWVGLPYEQVEYWWDSNGNGSGLDEFLQYSNYVGMANNRKQVLKNPDVYLSETEPEFIRFRIEEHHPRSSRGSAKFRFARL